MGDELRRAIGLAVPARPSSRIIAFGLSSPDAIHKATCWRLHLISRARPRPCRGRLRAIKEHRRRRIDTVFAHLRTHAPCFEACVCGRSAALSPMAAIFPHPSTPELRYFQAKLGCKFSISKPPTSSERIPPRLSLVSICFMSGLLIPMKSSIATAVRHSPLHGHGPTITSFGKPPDPKLLSRLPKASP